MPTTRPRVVRSTPVVRTADYPRAREFYRDALGFECVEEGGDPPRFGIFERDGAMIMVNGWQPPPPHPGAGFDAYFHVHNLDGFRNGLVRAGVEVPEITLKVYDQREFELRDPDGNIVCFGEAPQPKPVVRRTHYVLAVHDLEVTRRWYETTLGCTSTEVDPGNWVFMRMENVTFMAGRCPDAAPAHEIGDHSYLGYILVENIDRLAEKVASAGAQLIKPVRDEPWGMREFGLRTVDGHRFMFGEEIE